MCVYFLWWGVWWRWSAKFALKWWCVGLWVEAHDTDGLFKDWTEWMCGKQRELACLRSCLFSAQKCWDLQTGWLIINININIERQRMHIDQRNESKTERKRERREEERKGVNRKHGWQIKRRRTNEQQADKTNFFIKLP